MGGNNNIPTMKTKKVLKISKDGKTVLGVYDKEISSVVIPDGIETIEGFAFSDCSLLKKIELPKNLKSIGYHAFPNCNSLTSIKIPGGVENLDCDGIFWYCEKLKKIELEEGIEALDYIFSGCTAVKTITIPNSLRTLDGLVFSDFKSLRNIVLAKDNPHFVVENNVLYSKDKKRIIRALPCIGPHFIVPKSVRVIDRFAFSGCKHLEEITIHNQVRNIGHGAFTGCKKLKRIELPEKIKIIEQYSFDGCTSLSDVVLPSGLKEIGWNAFWNCKSLRHIHLPESVRSIQTGFAHSLQEYTVSPDNKYFTAIDGVLYNKDLTKLIEMPRECNVRTFTVPDSVKSIGYNAFFYCEKLKNIILPQGLKEIGNGAFSGCRSLKSICLPAGIKKISQDTFSNCESLAYVELPATLKIIEEDAFRGCEFLQFVFPPLSLRYVANGAFPNNLVQIYTRCCNPTQIDANVLSNMCQYNEWEVSIEVPQGTLSKYEKLNFYGNCVLSEMIIPLSKLEKPCMISFDDNAAR